MQATRAPLLACLFLVGCADSSQEAVRQFPRPRSSPGQMTTVRLKWAKNTQPPFYTPRGPMREITISEANHTVHVPPSQISSIEDIWPGRVQLISWRPGDYSLEIPYGVGEGALELVQVRAFRVVKVSDVPLAQPVPFSR